MTRITLSRSQRMLTFAGLLALLGAGLPGTAHAQAMDGERVLLNKTGAAFGVSRPPAPHAVDGERALLGRTGAGELRVSQPGAAGRSTLAGAYRIDGERALLRQSVESKAPREGSASRY